MVASAGCADSRDGGGGGTCEPECAAFQACCNSTCATISNDPGNCGGCGITCASGICRSGVCEAPTDSGPPTDTGMMSGTCTPACSSAQRCCGTACVNREGPSGDGRSDTSFMNCNGCGLACDPIRASTCGRPIGAGGTPRCLCGSFGECAPGEACASSGGSFQCVNLQTDKNNCGTIGNACPGDETCTGGECSCGGATCGAGSMCCGGSCIDVMSDEANCGACRNDCGATGDSCVGGSCRCGSGAGCRPTSGSDKGQICCDSTCVDNNDAHCGACDKTCEGGAMNTCIVGSSFFPMGSDEGVCCGFAGLPFGGGGFCLDLPFPGGDGGLPFGLDGGLPFP